LKDTKLIRLTAWGRRGDAARVEKIGFDAYLTKPLKASQLFQCLVTIFGYSEAEAEKSSKPKLVTRHSLLEAKKTFRILLAEDNTVNQRLAVTFLKKAGFQVDAVANGAEAVKALQHIPYDIVLMDIQMPEMDGYEATKIIRDPQTDVLRHDIPIIALTANAMARDRERCLKAGMDDYIAKPIKRDELIQIVENFLQK